MALSLEEVRRAAALSRLKLTAAEEELFAGQLGRIVDHIDHLREFQAAAEEIDPESGVEAGDEPQPDPRSELFLDSAPDSRAPFFAVPRMLAGSGRAGGEGPGNA
jgi:aspartyl-tRNA(Asn)/glutamyl-tRNA(Gln) amidotransferase subunit C